MREVIFDHDSLSDLSKELLAYGRYFRFKARGSSMYPFIQDGDIITVQPIDPSGLNVGDIILYQAEKSLVVHRIIAKQTFHDKMYFTTRGDASPGCEENILIEEVLGKVVTLERNGKILKVNHGLSQFFVKCWLMCYPLGISAIRFASGIKRGILWFFR